MLINHSVSNELVPQVTYQSLGKRVGMGFEIELVCRYQPLCKQQVSVLVSLPTNKSRVGTGFGLDLVRRTGLDRVGD